MNIVEELTIQEVKDHLGLSLSDTSRDDQIRGAIAKFAPLYLEDFFTISELRRLTANQKLRLRLGMSMVLAGELLYPIAMSTTINDAGSVRLGPLSVSGGSSGAANTLQRRARELKRDGEEILETLRIAVRTTLSWGVV